MSRKAVIYTRVSTDEQREKGFSLQDQQARLMRYCQQQGWQVIEHYQDDHSAKNFNRPEFNRFLTEAEEGKINPDVFLCVRMDRFSRNLEESLRMLGRFKSLGIEFKTLENNYDLSQPENLIPYILNMVLPQVENERRGLNTKRGMRQAQREGRWMAKPPRGYCMKREGNVSLLYPDDQAIYIKRAFKEYAKGIYTMEEVRLKLIKEGFKRCTKQHFTNILRNPAYMGKIRIAAWKDEPEEIVNGLHEGLVSEDLFHTVQAILKGKHKNSTNFSMRKEELPLRGFLTCRKCGGNLTGSASRSRNGSRHYYYHCQKGCKERFRADQANAALVDHLNKISIPSEVLNLYHAIMQDLFKTDDKERLIRLGGLTTQIKEQESRIEKLVDKFADDLIDVPTYQKTKKRYEAKRDDLIASKAELERQDTNFMRYVRYGFSLLHDLPTYYQQASLHIKHKMLGSIFPEKLIFEENNYRTTRTNAVLELLTLKTNEIGAKKEKLTFISEDQSTFAPPLGLEPRTY